MVDEPQPEVEELDEVVIPEQIVAHKERKVRGKFLRRYLVKFQNYSGMDAKWMEEVTCGFTTVVATLSRGFWSGAYLVKRALYRFNVKIDLASYLGQWGIFFPSIAG